MKKMLFILYNILLLFVLSLIYRNLGIVIIGFLSCLFFIVPLMKKQDNLYFHMGVIITITFVFLIVQYFALIGKFGEPYYASDDKAFEAASKSLIDNNIYSFKEIPYIAGMYYAKGYCLILAYIERIVNVFGFTYHTVDSRVFNLYLWLSTCLLSYRLFSINLKRKESIKILYVLSLFANSLYISCFTYRDTVVCFLIALFSYCGLMLFGNNNLYNMRKENDSISRFFKHLLEILLMAICIYCMFYIRMQLIYVMALMLLFIILVSKIKSRTKKIFSCLAAAIIGLIFLFYTGGLAMLNETSESYSDLRYLSNGLSKIVFSLNILPFGIFLRLIYGLISPFPGGLLELDFISNFGYSMILFFVYFGTIFQIFMLPYLFKKIKKLEIESILFLILFLTVVTTTFTFRHFILIYPFMAVLVGPEYFACNVQTRKKYSMVICTLLLCVGFIYLFIKI